MRQRSRPKKWEERKRAEGKGNKCHNKSRHDIRLSAVRCLFNVSIGGFASLKDMERSFVRKATNSIQRRTTGWQAADAGLFRQPESGTHFDFLDTSLCPALPCPPKWQCCKCWTPKLLNATWRDIWMPFTGSEMEYYIVVPRNCSLSSAMTAQQISLFFFFSHL